MNTELWEEFEVNITEEQANSPGIDDWIEAKRRARQ